MGSYGGAAIIGKMNWNWKVTGNRSFHVRVKIAVCPAKAGQVFLVCVDKNSKLSR